MNRGSLGNAMELESTELLFKEGDLPSWLRRLPSLGSWFLFVGWVVTFTVSFLLYGILHQDRRMSFERSSAEVQNRVEERFRLYEFSLLQIQAFAHFGKNGNRDRAWPETDAVGVTFPPVHFEPVGENDVTDPIRARAMERALVSGSVVASEPTHLDATESESRPWGFYLYAPILDRSKSLLGFVSTAFRFDQLMPQAIPLPYPPTIHRIQVVSGAEPAMIFYDSDRNRQKPPKIGAVDLPLNLPGIDRAFFLRVFPKPVPIFSHLNLIPFFSSFLGILLTLALWREVLNRERLRNALADGVALRTRQLRKLLAEQKRTNADLQVLNEDLESFGYSVSHDLRAPLRGIDSFGVALEEEYSAQLGENGKRYVEFMRDGARRAGRILDDLLRLSRLSRAEPTMTEVDLGTIAAGIIEALRKDEPDRRVEFEIVGERLARGDAGLIRIALENVLANAWKFTRNRKDARIVLRGIRRRRGVDFQVEDNGAGFPQEHVSELFGVFRRLHSAKEFPGTGVGLAIVKRVALKHSGRVWAMNRTEGGGAIFGFSLPAAT